MWAIKRNLELLGFDVTLFAQPFRAKQTLGIPDMYIRHSNWQFRAWIEVKTPTGKLRPHQAAWIANEICCGGHAFIARSMDDVLSELVRLGCPIK